MLEQYKRCPKCGTEIQTYENPFPTVDVIIEYEGNNGEKGIVLIFRKNEPHAWALPGGFVEYGETLEHAAQREAEEETSLKVTLVRQFHTYSDSARDPRQHTISTIFIATASGRPEAGDDAQDVKVFSRGSLPENIAFDHREILDDYFHNRY